MRWEMEITVRPADARRSASSTRASVSRVEVGRDFIQQKHGGIGRRRAGDGKELPFALRKHAVRAARVIAVGKRADGRIQPGKPRGLPRHVPRNARVAQRDLVEHRARHAGKMLLHAADARAALGDP